MDPLKIGIGVSSVGRFLPLIAKAAGLFEREKLSVEIVNQRDEERAVPDIVSGATPIGTPNAPSLVFSVPEGSDLVIVGGLLNRPAFYLAADPSIATVADLKGKRVGINQPRRMAGMVMLALLRNQKPNPAIYNLVERRGDAPDPSIAKLALLTSIRLAAARTVELGEAPATVDFISTEGLKFPRGPLAELDELGAEAVLKDLATVNDAIPGNRMKAPKLLTAMAGERQTFYLKGQANPWVTAFVEGRSHARH